MQTSHRFNSVGYRLFVIVSLSACFLGCGGDQWQRQAIHGKATLDGQPANGSLLLTPDKETKGPAVSVTVDAGTYACSSTDGPVPGVYMATLVPSMRKSGGPPQPRLPAVQVKVPADGALEIDITFSSNDTGGRGRR